MVSNAQVLTLLVAILAVAGGGVLAVNSGLLSDSSNPSVSTTPTPTTNSPTPSPATTTQDNDTDPTPTPTDTPTKTAQAVQSTPVKPDSAEARLDVSQLRAELEARITAKQDHPQTLVDESMYTNTSRSRRLERMGDDHTRRMAAHETVAHTIDGSTTQERYDRYMRSQNCYVISNSGESFLPKTKLEAIHSYEYTSGDESMVAQEITDDLFFSRSTRRVLTLDDAQRMGIGIAIQDDTIYVDVLVC